MTRLVQWPILGVCLAGGLAVGRYAGPAIAHGEGPAKAAAIPSELTSYRDIVKQVLPAVVSIESKVKTKKLDGGLSRRGAPRLDMMPGLPEEFRKQFEDMQRRMPPEHATGFGSGFIVDAKGVIMTNNHVVDGADEVEVTLTDGRKFTSTDIKTDPKSDLAIVRVKADSPLPTIKLGDSSQMEIGDRVLAIGAPFRMAGSVTHGIISAKGRDLGDRGRPYDDFLQTDAAINPGNSGGPLVNLAGEVIGINTAIKSGTGGFQGIGLAITSNQAKNVVQQLATNGVVKRAYLGVEMASNVSPAVAERLGMKNGHGVVIAKVVENSPAAKAGIKADDVIEAINGQSIKDARSLVRAVGNLPIGKPAQVEILRDGKVEKLTLTMEQMPSGYGEKTLNNKSIPVEKDTVKIDKLGMELTDLPVDRYESFGVKGGALVVAVENGSSAEAGGIQSGLAIYRVNRKEVNSAEAAKQELEKADLSKGVLVHLRSADGGTVIALLKTAAK